MLPIGRSFARAGKARFHGPRIRRRGIQRSADFMRRRRSFPAKRFKIGILDTPLGVTIIPNETKIERD